jgi:hypothetical protein
LTIALDIGMAVALSGGAAGASCFGGVSRAPMGRKSFHDLILVGAIDLRLSKISPEP